MASIILFHSVVGLRPVERAIAARLRNAGHTVTTPDLYEGRTATSAEGGFALLDEYGWSELIVRARAALSPLPATTVLAGVSLGAGMVGELWSERPDCAGILMLHALGDVPATARSGTPAQAHVADPDPFAPPEKILQWRDAATRNGLDAVVYTYPGVGHFFSDATLPDYNAAADAATWARVLPFLADL